MIFIQIYLILGPVPSMSSILTDSVTLLPQSSHLVSVREYKEIKKTLLVLSREEPQFWNFPGGKVESKEDPMTALTREIWEDLSGAQVTNPVFYKSHIGISPRRKIQMKVNHYFGDLPEGAQIPSNEIESVRWFSYEEAQALENLPGITRITIEELRESGRL